MSKEDKAEFFKKNHQLCGDGLKAAITVSTESVFKKTRSNSFAANDEWMDEDDLEAKFRAKPNQLENVKAHAKTMICPVRNCTLYAVPSYTSIAMDKQEGSTERSITTETESNRKAIHAGEPKEKKPRVEKGDPPLTETAIAKLSKVVEMMDAHKTFAEECLVHELANEVPKKLRDQVSLKLADFMAHRAVVMMALDSKIGKMKDLQSGTTHTLSELDTALGKVRTIIDDLQ